MLKITFVTTNFPARPVTQHTAHSTQHTAHNTQHTAHNTQHTAHNTQHTAHSTQDTAHNTQHTLLTKMCRNGKRSTASGLAFLKEISGLAIARHYGILVVMGTHGKLATLLYVMGFW
jgi:hypothetical protein